LQQEWKRKPSLSSANALVAETERVPKEAVSRTHVSPARLRGDKLEPIVELFPEELGLDVDSQHFRETPARVALSYRGFTRGLSVRPQDILKTFRSPAHELVVVWRETRFLTEREQAAPAWTEAVTKIGQDYVPDEVDPVSRQYFDQKKLVDPTLSHHRDRRLEQAGDQLPNHPRQFNQRVEPRGNSKGIYLSDAQKARKGKIANSGR
jgi:hypothetical protein